MLLELSYPISPRMPVFPGLPLDEFTPHVRMKSGGEANTSIIHHPLHNGTHVDAPFHFDDDGLTIDQLPVESFVFRQPLLIRKDLGRGGLISTQDLESAGPGLRTADILLLCTGYGVRRSEASVYIDDFPALSIDAARMIRTELLNVRAVAIDTLSIESCTQGPRTSNAVHRTLLSSRQYKTRPLLIFEDVNVAAVVGRSVSRILAFPLRFEGLEASPVNIVAEVL